MDDAAARVLIQALENNQTIKTVKFENCIYPEEIVDRLAKFCARKNLRSEKIDIQYGEDPRPFNSKVREAKTKIWKEEDRERQEAARDKKDSTKISLAPTP